MFDLDYVQTKFFELFLSNNSETSNTFANHVIDMGVVSVTSIYKGGVNATMKAIGGKCHIQPELSADGHVLVLGPSFFAMLRNPGATI